jgi:hypothetical protein
MGGKRWIATIALCAIVAFAAGWFGGSVSSAPPSTAVIASEAPKAAPSTTVGADIDRALGDLLVELRGLRADLRNELRASSTREPAAAVKESAPTDLVTAMNELTRALHEQPVRGERAGTSLGVRSPATATGFATLEDLFKPGKKPDGPAAGHLFWTLQDVIDRYGQPQFIRTDERSGVLIVHYSKPDDPRSYWEFELYGGQVIDVSSNSLNH